MSFPWPTPRPQSSDWMQELGEALTPHPDPGIESEELITLGNNYSSFSDKTPTPRSQTWSHFIFKITKVPTCKTGFIFSKCRESFSKTDHGLFGKNRGTQF